MATRMVSQAIYLYECDRCGAKRRSDLHVIDGDSPWYVVRRPVDDPDKCCTVMQDYNDTWLCQECLQELVSWFDKYKNGDVD